MRVKGSVEDVSPVPVKPSWLISFFEASAGIHLGVTSSVFDQGNLKDDNLVPDNSFVISENSTSCD